jgi:hypothetical protein
MAYSVSVHTAAYIDPLLSSDSVNSGHRYAVEQETERLFSALSMPRSYFDDSWHYSGEQCNHRS